MRHLIPVLLLTLTLTLAACGASAPPPAPTITPTLVASSTPPPPITANAYDNIPTGFSDAGFPQLGDTTAPITVIEYGSYDSAASQLAHDEIYAGLLARVELGEVRYVFIPLNGTGSAVNGRDAAAAALCAGEQGAYWAYHDQLFARLAREGEDAYTGSALLDAADTVGLDRDIWAACIDSERPAAVLDAAVAAAAEEASYSGTPTILVNGSYMLNDVISINNVIDQMIRRVDAETGAVGNLATPIYDNPDDAPEIVQLDLDIEGGLPSPINVTLPDGWSAVLEDTLLLQDIDAIRTVPFTLYKGPVPGGTGNIALLWGFPSLIAGNPLTAQAAPDTLQPNLYTDGLRMLRLAIVEQGCNVGTDVQRQYDYGSFTGIGAEWSAVDCPELADTRGWFVGTIQNNLNYLFFIYVEPINPAAVTEEERLARQQLRDILETVSFRTLDEIQGSSE